MSKTRLRTRACIVAAFAITVAAASAVSPSADAQCVGPTYSFSPTWSGNQGREANNYVWTPRGAVGATQSVNNAQAFIAQMQAWQNGELAQAPSYAFLPEQQLDSEFKLFVGDSIIVQESLIGSTQVFASEAFISALRDNSWISRVVGGNDGVPIDLLPRLPQRPPPLEFPMPPRPDSDAIASSAETVNAHDGVVAITYGTGAMCNGVHLGGGRILTNLHCALDEAPRRVLFGNVAFNINKLEGELNCTARRVWPEVNAASPAIDAAILQISVNGALPREFTASRFDDVYFRPASQNAWGQQARPLIAIQVYPVYADHSTRLQHRVEDGRWAGSRCQAYAQVPEQQLASNYCVPTEPRAEVQNVGRGHGCDTVRGSSGTPLFVETTNGALELVGLHRMGAGPSEREDVDPTLQNWNCAIPSSWFSTTIPQH